MKISSFFIWICQLFCLSLYQQKKTTKTDKTMKFIVFCIKLLVVIGVCYLVSLGFYGIIYLICPTNAVEIFGCIMVVFMGIVIFGMLSMVGLPGAFDKTWLGKGIQYVFDFLE